MKILDSVITETLMNPLGFDLTRGRDIIFIYYLLYSIYREFMTVAPLNPTVIVNSHPSSSCPKTS
jgi:hypothetical protein